MENIINATEEIEASAKYTDIRFVDIRNAVSADVEDDMDIVLQLPWDNSSSSDSLRQMSAVCFLFARNIYDICPSVSSSPTGAALPSKRG